MKVIADHTPGNHLTVQLHVLLLLLLLLGDGREHILQRHGGHHIRHGVGGPGEALACLHEYGRHTDLLGVRRAAVPNLPSLRCFSRERSGQLSAARLLRRTLSGRLDCLSQLFDFQGNSLSFCAAKDTSF